MKVECGCEFNDEDLPKDHRGERVLTCEHGRWKFAIIRVVKEELVGKFTLGETDYD